MNDATPADSAGPDPISWREIPENLPVVSSDDQPVGHVSEVLGSQEEDVFHGLEVHLSTLGHRVLVPAARVSAMTTAAVTLAITSAEVHELPEHTEERAYELGWTGRFRKRIGWVREKDWDR